MEWKQYVRRIKTTRQRAIVLEEKTKKNKMLNIFDTFKEKIEVITIQKLLEEAVRVKMDKYRYKKVFRKLRKNFVEIQ